MYAWNELKNSIEYLKNSVLEGVLETHILTIEVSSIDYEINRLEGIERRLKNALEEAEKIEDKETIKYLTIVLKGILNG